mmetsp:Transcript_19775/g.50191  ORF Transcript_19775/g.50191 Transcript_19775/m.50191 type:complete len:301 (-) Transcript_19775:997-1899(-)
MKPSTSAHFQTSVQLMLWHPYTAAYSPQVAMVASAAPDTSMPPCGAKAIAVTGAACATPTPRTGACGEGICCPGARRSQSFTTPSPPPVASSRGATAPTGVPGGCVMATPRTSPPSCAPASVATGSGARRSHTDTLRSRPALTNVTWSPASATLLTAVVSRHVAMHFCVPRSHALSERSSHAARMCASSAMTARSFTGCMCIFMCADISRLRASQHRSSPPAPPLATKCPLCATANAVTPQECASECAPGTNHACLSCPPGGALLRACARTMPSPQPDTTRSLPSSARDSAGPACGPSNT